MHTHTHTHILTPSRWSVNCVHFKNARHCVPKSKGQPNQRRLPGVPSLFKDKGTRNRRPVLPVFSYIENTRFWEWMWCCRDFSSLQSKTTETRWCISTSLLQGGLFLAKQNLEWRIYSFSAQATPLLSNSFNASNDQDVQSRWGFVLKKKKTNKKNGY